MSEPKTVIGYNQRTRVAIKQLANGEFKFVIVGPNRFKTQAEVSEVVRKMLYGSGR